MHEPTESLKGIANRLARLVASGAGLEVAQRLQLVAPSPAPVKSAETSPQHSYGTRVGIWEARQQPSGPAFTRIKSMMSEWRHWANIGQIEQKGSRTRVLLLGESVARGYFYDPHYTPAMVLQECLESHMGSPIEVIDLARTAIGLEVRELALATHMLEPDAVVMFCGNNWSVRFPDDLLDRAELSEAVRERGIASCMDYAESTLRLEAQSVLEDIASYYGQRDIPLLWIVPEFNLDGWRDPVSTAPHLPGRGNTEWLDCRDRAQRDLAAGAPRAAAESARRMIELDGGIVAAGYYLLSDACRATGDLGGARKALESARDASIWDTSCAFSPRTTRIAQEALRNVAATYDNAIVDSPRLFEEYLEGGIPGRDLFLDYCHLTSQGIKVTMAAVASSLLRRFEQVEVRWRDLADRAADPAREVQSEARFLAAIHNAHWWQGQELIQHHVSEAFRLSPHLGLVAREYLAIQSVRTPALMCGAAERMASASSSQVLHYVFAHNNQQLDRSLTEAVLTTLDGIDAGARAQIDRLRLEEHSVVNQTIDLLDYYYSSSAGQPQEIGWVPKGSPARRADYYRAFSGRSDFVFVAEANLPVRLVITCRIPHPASSSEVVTLSVNHRPVGDMSCSAAWAMYEVELAPGVLRNGLNQVTLHWPTPEFPGDHALAQAAEHVLAGRPLEAYCSFGDIHTLTATGI